LQRKTILGEFVDEEPPKLPPISPNARILTGYMWDDPSLVYYDKYDLQKGPIYLPDFVNVGFHHYNAMTIYYFRKRRPK
jgi:hypothetical protein